MIERDIKMVRAINGAERLIRGVTEKPRTDEEIIMILNGTLDDIEWLVKFAKKVYDATGIEFDIF